MTAASRAELPRDRDLRTLGAAVGALRSRRRTKAALGACALALGACASTAPGPQAEPAAAIVGPLSMHDGVSDAPSTLAGVWRSRDTGSDASIEATDVGFVVTGVVDDDGEVFDVLASHWAEPTLGWSVLVPSTGYEVTFACVHDALADLLRCTWRGTAGEGEVLLDRVD
jgi:hypothetical protein